jgi:recombination protein RecR
VTYPFAGAVSRCIDELARLPGIGPKTASRLTYFLLRAPESQARALAEALLALKENTTFCSRCCNIADTDPCAICTNPNRDVGLLCIVEEPLDLIALERTGQYKGLYQVLHGVLSPLEGVGPEDLRIPELLARFQEGQVREVILATNPSLEGEATAMYLHSLIQPFGPSITRLARGLPVGSDLEYADDLTLTRALQGRQVMERAG